MRRLVIPGVGRGLGCLVLAIAFALGALPRAEALETGVGAVAAESSIYEDSTGSNGGGYANVCVGNLSSTALTRRAYMRFDLPSGIPSSAVVTRVQLVLTQESVRIIGGPLTATLRLNRVTGAWTEGTGTSAAAGPCSGGANVVGIDWANAPAVAATTSGTESLPATNSTTIIFDTNVGTDDDVLINDVQAWVNGSANNGWRLRLTAEATLNNARAIRGETLTVFWTLPNGSSCDFDNDCNSDSCLRPDGNDCNGAGGCVCCNASTCAEACESCFLVGSTGTCSPVLAETIECQAASCLSSTEESPAVMCDGFSNTCPAPTVNACTPYACSGSACNVSCIVGGDCVAGAVCDETNMCVAPPPVPASTHPAIMALAIAASFLLLLGLRELPRTG